MQQFQTVCVLVLLFHPAFSQYLKCPTFCICYVWEALNRVDCVAQGLLDVHIGVDGDGRKEGKDGKNLIQVLDLSHNSISSLNNGAFDCGDLRQMVALHLSHNSIAHISPSALQGLKNLQLLDLSYNRLRRNPAVPSGGLQPHPVLLPAQIFKDARNLGALRLGYNPLEKEVHDGKTSKEDGEPLLLAPNLEFLDLGSCHLGHVGSKSFSDLQSLRMLNLSDNQLIHLNPSTMASLTNLEELQLQYNPWPCSDTEDMEKLESWLSNKGFTRACPEKKFEKIVALNPRLLGPQKAHDEDSLLFYYLHLGGLIVKASSPPKGPHSDTGYMDDVEVFDKNALKPIHHHLDRLLDASDSNQTAYISDQFHDFYCSIYGIPVGWFLGFSFLTGIFVAIIISFLYFAKPCNWNECLLNAQKMMRRRSSLRRTCQGRRKRMSWNRRSRTLSRVCAIDVSVGEFMLMHESEDEQQSMGLTTPIMPRAVSAASSRRSATPPPSYEEHLALQTIRTDH